MAVLNKLNHSQVKSANKIGLLSDGCGLYLQISKAGYSRAHVRARETFETL